MSFLQVEDITASHEAALLEMENNHTVAITILQDDHDHKVQGIYEPVCSRPVGKLNPSGDRAKDPSSPSFLSFYLSAAACMFIPERRRSRKQGLVQGWGSMASMQ